MRCYFVRHGESEANKLAIISNRGLRHGLTSLGEAQAAELGGRLAAMGVRDIYSSPLLRARQTAEIVARACQVSQVVVTDALREFDCGVLEGRSDPDAWARYRRLVEAWRVSRNYDAREPGGESFFDVRKRFVPFIRQFSSAAAEPGSAQALVLVGHGGLFYLMLPLLLTNIDRDFPATHPLAHCSVVVADAGPDGMVCIEWPGANLGH